MQLSPRYIQNLYYEQRHRMWCISFFFPLQKIALNDLHDGYSSKPLGSLALDHWIPLWWDVSNMTFFALELCHHEHHELLGTSPINNTHLWKSDLHIIPNFIVNSSQIILNNSAWCMPTFSPVSETFSAWAGWALDHLWHPGTVALSKWNESKNGSTKVGAKSIVGLCWLYTSRTSTVWLVRSAASWPAPLFRPSLYPNGRCEINRRHWFCEVACPADIQRRDITARDPIKSASSSAEWLRARLSTLDPWVPSAGPRQHRAWWEWTDARSQAPWQGNSSAKAGGINWSCFNVLPSSWALKFVHLSSLEVQHTDFSFMWNSLHIFALSLKNRPKRSPQDSPGLGAAGMLFLQSSIETSSFSLGCEGPSMAPKSKPRETLNAP